MKNEFIYGQVLGAQHPPPYKSAPPLPPRTGGEGLPSYSADLEAHFAVDIQLPEAGSSCVLQRESRWDVGSSIRWRRAGGSDMQDSRLCSPLPLHHILITGALHHRLPGHPYPH